MKKINILARVGLVISLLGVIFVVYLLAVQPIRRKKIIQNIVKYFPFSRANSLKEWEEKILKGRVIYKVEKSANGKLSYVRATSKNAASALYYKINLDIEKHPFISWKWAVEKFPVKKSPEAISQKKEEDFAARIYVIFPAAFFTNSRAIQYIWSESLPEGTSDVSAYSKNIKVLVIRSGLSKGEWESECRDVYADYKALFNEEPRLNIGAISFMTDSDSTNSESSCLYDDIEVGYKNPEVPNANNTAAH